jgi:hypothetical protein
MISCKVLFDDPVMQDELGEARSTRGRDKKCVQNFDWGTTGLYKPLPRHTPRCEDNVKVDHFIIFLRCMFRSKSIVRNFVRSFKRQGKMLFMRSLRYYTRSVV